MKREQAKVRYYNTEHRYLINKYQDADEYQWLNTDDIDLCPIRTKLPECPDWDLIVGFGKEPEDQVFERETIPFKIDYVTKKIKGDVRKDTKLETASSKYKSYYGKVWDIVENDRNYSDINDWLAEQWYYRINGKWYFIKGKPTYVCGWHWFYLNYWHIEDYGLPEYRDRDRRWFWAIWHCYKDTTVPIKDKDGLLLYNNDGSLQLEDVEYRTIEGVNGLKGRRMGDTTKTECINFCIISMKKEGRGGIQGDSADTGEEAFSKKLMFSFNKLPFFWKPHQMQLNPKAELIFDSDDTDFGLQSVIDFATTAGKNFYDGKKLHFYHGDETGKCLSIRSLVKMSDGSYKKVEEIEVGEYVMGINGTKRKVLNKVMGTDSMYKVIPSKFASWECNSKHILTVKWARAERSFEGKKKGDIIDIPIEDYLKLPYGKQKHMVLFKGLGDNSVSDFIVEPSGIGMYCGLTLEGDGMFMLSDNTVVHNCTLEDIHERHSVIRRCLKTGSRLIGFLVYTTTVDDMSLKSGVEFEKLTNNSHYQNRSGGGYTMSGMVNLFFPAYDGFEGFIGKYGESIMGTPTEEQLKYVATKKKNQDGIYMGARDFLEAEREALVLSGDFVELAHQKRLYPFTFAECFTPPSQNIFFNMNILDTNYIDLKRDNKAAIQGDFVWVDGRDSFVDFFPNENGKWYVSKLLQREESNRKFTSNGMYYPSNMNKYVSSSDAFRLEKVQGGRKSNGAGVVRWRRDASIDPDTKELSQWQSARAIAVYRNRPNTLDEYCEDMLMADIYYGAMQYPENNVNHVADHYMRRGYAGYLLHDTDQNTGALKANAGFFSGGALKQKLFNLVAEDIQKHGLRCRHIQITEERKKIKGLDDMTNCDLFTADAGTLLAEESQHSLFLMQMQQNEGYDISGCF